MRGPEYQFQSKYQYHVQPNVCSRGISRECAFLQQRSFKSLCLEAVRIGPELCAAGFTCLMGTPIHIIIVTQMTGTLCPPRGATRARVAVAERHSLFATNLTMDMCEDSSLKDRILCRPRSDVSQIRIRGTALLPFTFWCMHAQGHFHLLVLFNGISRPQL